LIQNDLVNGFSSLKEPPGAFVEDEDEDQELGIANDEWFTNPESEIFTL
jgi:hypothetical protein